ncbi:unnamed protein product [Rotaria sp. Silwood2]|nr:unnamed protein product [Rotaria sp. Silwood2]
MAFLILYCNARVKQESIQSTKKPSCIPIGDLCNDVVDCCGNDDPDVGHCVYCRTSWPFGRHQRCDCSSSGAVTTTDDGIVNSDRCAGRDRRLNRCRVSVARPGTFWARGNNVHPKKTKNAGPYDVQANGQRERFNGNFLSKILAPANEQKSDWDDKLLPVAFNYSNTRHATTTFTPFELMFGRECRVPADRLNNIAMPTENEYATQMQRYIEFSKIMARKNIEQNQQEMKIRYDTSCRNPEYKIGDKVLIFNQHSANKLTPKYIEPYTIVKRLGNKTYQVPFNSTAPIHNITLDKMQPIN